MARNLAHRILIVNPVGTIEKGPEFQYYTLPMLFKQFQHEEGACLSYVIGCTRTAKAAVIDAQLDIQPYLQYVSSHNLKLTHIFETHSQADHLSGAKKLSEATGVPAYFYDTVKANFSIKRVKDEDEIRIGNILLKILYTPGHTLDSMCIIVTDTTRADEPWFVLTGDTLFVGDVGRPDLNGSPEDLYESLYKKLMKLPDSLEVFPAHYAGSVCGKDLSPKPSSTIGFERRFNAALQFKSKNEFIDFVNSGLPAQPPLFEKVRAFNLGFLVEPPIGKTADEDSLEISVEELKEKLHRGEKLLLLDVREPVEFQIANLGGQLIPLRQLPQRMKELNPNQEIIVHCHTGNRSARAVEFLHQNGFNNVKNLVGGIDAWSRRVDPKVPRY
ncbi:MAG TPA: MBL fold metallo-hydrolase [Bacteroidota bacterium]|nr:MBL fold metallo-hydrolase [Bacteroidota bacterium]